MFPNCLQTSWLLTENSIMIYLEVWLLIFVTYFCKFMKVHKRHLKFFKKTNCFVFCMILKDFVWFRLLPYSVRFRVIMCHSVLFGVITRYFFKKSFLSKLIKIEMSRIQSNWNSETPKTLPQRTKRNFWLSKPQPFHSQKGLFMKCDFLSFLVTK